MKYSMILMGIYRKFLGITAELVEILERHCKNINENKLSPELKNKYQEFRRHTYKLIEVFNTDLHLLLKIDNELKELEILEKEKNNEKK